MACGQHGPQPHRAHPGDRAGRNEAADPTGAGDPPTAATAQRLDEQLATLEGFNSERFDTKADTLRSSPALGAEFLTATGRLILLLSSRPVAGRGLSPHRSRMCPRHVAAAARAFCGSHPGARNQPVCM